MPKKVGVNYRQLIIPFLILVAVIVIDQLTKLWAVGNLIEGEIKQVIGQFFQLKLIYNQGGALGIDLGSNIFYLATSLVILIFIISFVYSNRDKPAVSRPLALIAGGAVGNIIDRIASGRVVDFLDFDFFDFQLFGNKIERWWTFNVADAAITVGIILLVIWILFSAGSKGASATPPPGEAGNIESSQDF